MRVPIDVEIRQLQRKLVLVSRVTTLCVLLISVLVLVAAAQSTPESLRLRNLEIVDAAGRVRISLSAFDGIEPAVEFYDDKAQSDGLPNVVGAVRLVDGKLVVFANATIVQGVILSGGAEKGNLV